MKVPRGRGGTGPALGGAPGSQAPARQWGGTGLPQPGVSQGEVRRGRRAVSPWADALRRAAVPGRQAPLRVRPESAAPHVRPSRRGPPVPSPARRTPNARTPAFRTERRHTTQRAPPGAGRADSDAHTCPQQQYTQCPGLGTAPGSRAEGLLRVPTAGVGHRPPHQSVSLHSSVLETFLDASFSRASETTARPACGSGPWSSPAPARPPPSRPECRPACSPGE